MADQEVREPKQDRSRATRDALLGAAIASLAEKGWTATTVGGVAELAGVSRGAAQHHFPTREDLITAALEHVVAQRVEQVRSGLGALPDPGPERTRAVVDLVVVNYTSDLFKAALHVWTAAASDTALRDRVVPLELAMSREVLAMAAEALGADLAVTGTRRALQTTLDLARGLGLSDVLADDSERRAKIVAHWAETLHGQLPGG